MVNDTPLARVICGWIFIISSALSETILLRMSQQQETMTWLILMYASWVLVPIIALFRKRVPYLVLFGIVIATTVLIIGTCRYAEECTLLHGSVTVIDVTQPFFPLVLFATGCILIRGGNLKTNDYNEGDY